MSCGTFELNEKCTFEGPVLIERKEGGKNAIKLLTKRGELLYKICKGVNKGVERRGKMENKVHGTCRSEALFGTARK